MSKITNLVRRATVISAVTGALIIGSTGMANASVPAAQAPVAVSSAGMSRAVQAEDPIAIQGAGECTHYLEIWGYTLTNARRYICAVASFPIPSAPTRIAVCTAALLATGVGTVVAPIACTLATGP